MQIISKNNLFILLKKYSGIFFVSDDKEIDPFEVKIVISNLKSTKSFYEEKIPDYIIDSDGKQRKLVWLNEKLYGLNTWAVLWKKNSKIISDNLLELTEEDNDAFILWTELFLSEKPNWVRINAVEGLKKKYGLKDEEALYYHLAEYMHKNSITPRYKYICDMPASFATFQSKKNRMEYSLIQCKLKIHRKLLFRRLTLKTIIHNMFTRKRFVNRLKREGILSKKWSLVNDGKGSSASTLIKVVRDGWTEFIKGNELKQYTLINKETKQTKTRK